MAPSATVETAQGKLSGRRCKTKVSKVPYCSFRGIPYAKPPIGELRFSLPEEPESWDGVKNCCCRFAGFGGECTPCIQRNVILPEKDFLIFGKEDCLYLNVFTPRLQDVTGTADDCDCRNNGPLPVIVWFHGGAFSIGDNNSSIYGPDTLFDGSPGRGVVLVTVQYRLGPFGFLSFENDQAPGNVGLHDQTMSLRWVHKNAAKFGGDPNNVTIMGESAGAMSCFLHLVSPTSRGLFHKVIAMSGSGSTPFMHNDRSPALYAEALAQHLGAKPDSTRDEKLKHLRSMPARDIARSSLLFKNWDVPNILPWTPKVDGSWTSTPFLPKSFAESVEAGNFARNVPILTGVTADEGLILAAPFFKDKRKWTKLFKEWDKWAPHNFFNRETDLITADDIAASQKIREKFFGTAADRIPDYNDENLKKLAKIFSLSTFYGTLATDSRLLAESGTKVYSYKLNHQGTMTMLDIFRLSLPKLLLNFTGRFLGFKMFRRRLGVCHSDDLLYVFPMGPLPNPLSTESDRRVSGHMTAMWSNFAASGDPGAPGFAAMNAPGWRPLGGRGDNCQAHMLIDIDLAMEDGEERRVEEQEWNEIVASCRFTCGSSSAPITTFHKKVAVNRRESS